ncbi:methylmalonyl-CoA mutase family protein, partial [Salinibaculum sp. GCM10025337]
SVRDGVLHGIEDGYFDREIQDASYEYQQRVEAGEEVVVGVNEYTIEEETDPELLHVSDEVSETQLNRLEEVKAERNDDEVQERLDALSAAVENEENVMPPIIDAVKAYATMEEIMKVLEDHHGAYKSSLLTA